MVCLSSDRRQPTLTSLAMAVASHIHIPLNSVNVLPKWLCSQLNADQQAWEENRLLTSGVAMRNEVDTDFDDENEARVRIWVHKVGKEEGERGGSFVSPHLVCVWLI